MWEVRGRPALGPWPPRLCACGWHTPARPLPGSLPSRAPGKHPLSKVTAQGQPGAGVLVKALDRQGCQLWTDGQTVHRQTQGLHSWPGESAAAPPRPDSHSLSESVSYCEQSSGLGSSSQA